MHNDSGWASAFGSDANIATQVQNVTAFNGEGNFNGGNFEVAALQDVGDTGGGGSSGYGGWGDVNVATQVQTVTAFNGSNNINGGEFEVFAGQDVGDIDGPINDAGVMVNVDTENGIDIAVQVQTVTAFNGYGNINGANFAGLGSQDVGDMPFIDDMPSF